MAKMTCLYTKMRRSLTIAHEFELYIYLLVQGEFSLIITIINTITSTYTHVGREEE